MSGLVIEGSTVDVTLGTSDIEIGAVEIKNDSDDTRLKIGGGAIANAARVTVGTDDTMVGAVNETAPATDTASSGLNGRLQRIAQRITSMIALIPAALGQGTMAQSFRVVVASDQTPVSVTQGAAATGGYSFLNIAAGQATTVVKSGAGTLHSIILNSAATATNTTTVYDNTAASGTVIGRPAVTTATVPTTLIYDLAFATGLTIITATANGGDMTVTYK